MTTFSLTMELNSHRRVGFRPGRHPSGTRALMVFVAGAALVMWALILGGPSYLAIGIIPFVCAVFGWWRSRRKVLGSLVWAVAGGVVQALLFGGFFIMLSLIRKPTGPYQDTGWAVAITLFSCVASVLLAVVIGLLVAAAFRLAGDGPERGSSKR